MDVVLLLLVVVYLMAIIYAANQVELGEWTFSTLQPMLYGLIAMIGLLTFITVVGLWLPSPQLNGDTPIERLDPLALILSLLLVAGCLGGATLAPSPRVTVCRRSSVSRPRIAPRPPSIWRRLC